MSVAAAVSTTLETSSPATANGLSHRVSAAPATPSSTSHHPQPQSTTSTEANGGITAEETKELRRAFQKKYRHVAAIHFTSQPSTLSHDADSAPSFLGFRNLMVIVLVAGNLRLMIENLQKYGVLICIRCHDFRQHDLLLGLGLYVLIPCHLLAAYLIERTAGQSAVVSRAKSEARKKQHTDGRTSPTADEQRRFQATWRIVAWAHGINITLALAITSITVYFGIHHPLIGTLAELHALIVWLKTASYAFTNRDLRHAYLHPVAGELQALPPLYASCPYPQNITVGNLVYFWWAPTLVYQPVYPRTARIRWVFVLKRLAETFCLGVFIWFVAAQYAAPVLRNSLDKMDALDLPSILERLLKLSTISLVIWLAGFFALFQSFLNALAEVTRFADRRFYDDWWNSDSLGTYWKTWNKPVYQFFKRHVYSPMLGRGWNPLAASVAVFFVSGVLHELLVGVPTHNIIGVAFWGMFLQLVLIALTRPLEKMNSAAGRLIGNCIFWVSFTIFGQPFAAMIYFYVWHLKFGTGNLELGKR